MPDALSRLKVKNKDIPGDVVLDDIWLTTEAIIEDDIR